MRKSGTKSVVALTALALVALGGMPSQALAPSASKAKPAAPQIASVTETVYTVKGKVNLKYANVVVAIDTPADNVKSTLVTATGGRTCNIKAPKTSCEITKVKVGKTLTITAKSKTAKSGYGPKSTKATYTVGNVNSVAIAPVAGAPVTADGKPQTQGTVNQVGELAKPDTGVAAAPAPAPGETATATPELNAFWTAAQLEDASTREIIFDEEEVIQGKGKDKKKVKVASKSARIESAKRGRVTRVTNSTGQSWNGGGLPLSATGKVFFSFGSSTYVCSGSVVTDTATDRSVVLTAGHCAYNQATQQFATNWTFIPAYDSKPTGSCSDPANPFPYGCWTASALVVHSNFADQTAFNSTATQSDWAFAVFTAGASGTQLDATVGSLPLNEAGFTAAGSPTYSFGYPAASPYGGADLIFCNGNISTDANNSNTTWGLACNMTGGASGGPWTSSFSTSTNSGNLSSVNSYKYSTDTTKMYGPMFDSRTRLTFDKALIAGSNFKAS